jgi:hypothetical protein
MDDDFLKSTKDSIEEMLFGKTAVAAKRHQKELEHEQQLAVIRARSHALIWTGTAEELTQIIERWLSGWMVIGRKPSGCLAKSIHPLCENQMECQF